jgi:hypothetical protein
MHTIWSRNCYNFFDLRLSYQLERWVHERFIESYACSRTVDDQEVQLQCSDFFPQLVSPYMWGIGRHQLLLPFFMPVPCVRTLCVRVRIFTSVDPNNHIISERSLRSSQQPPFLNAVSDILQWDKLQCLSLRVQLSQSCTQTLRNGSNH